MKPKIPRHVVEEIDLSDESPEAISPGNDAKTVANPVVDASTTPHLYPRQTYISQTDDEYHEIYRRHNFSFASELPCRICGGLKPINQPPDRYGRQTCHDCHITQTSAETLHGPKNPRAAEKRWIEHEATSEAQDTKPRPKRSRKPDGFIEHKNLLDSLTPKAGPKRKSKQQEEADRLYEELLRKDEQMLQERSRMQSAIGTAFSPTHHYNTTTEPAVRLIKLGIKTASNTSPIWMEVSRSAPLGDMFIAALQSDDALRGHVFMLPDKYVRWDDTPDKLNLEENNCFEMHKLPETWLPNARIKEEDYRK